MENHFPLPSLHYPLSIIQSIVLSFVLSLHSPFSILHYPLTQPPISSKALRVLSMS